MQVDISNDSMTSDPANLVGSYEFVNENQPLHLQLCSATDFCLVDVGLLSKLSVLRREYGPLDLIADLGSPALHCWIVLQGSVEVFRSTNPVDSGTLGKATPWITGPVPLSHPTTTFRRCGNIVSPNSFGGDHIIMRTPLNFMYKAGPTRTVIALVPAAEYVTLIRKNRSFAQSISRRIVERYDIFSAFQSFCKEIFTTQENIDVQSLMEKYYDLDSVIHTKIKDPCLDTSAWFYSINRLPANITSTFVFELVRTLPAFLASRLKESAAKQKGAAAECHIGVIYVPTKDRRRASWQVGTVGKTLVLLRDGFTDLLDFLTNFCIHMVESRKLRVRLTSSAAAVDALESAVLSPERGNGEDTVLKQMPFTEEERHGLKKLWPHGVLRPLYDIIMRKEMVMVRNVETTSSYEIDPFLTWMLSIRSSLLRVLGLSPQDELPDNLAVDIISSNTHSVKNLLSPYVRQHRAEIVAWCHTNIKSTASMAWPCEEDMLYYLLPKYLASNPDLEDQHREVLGRYGITVIEDTSLTGLAVELFLVKDLDVYKMDPTLVKRMDTFEQGLSRSFIHVIVNTDFAFGAQADGIMRALILLFGQRIRSVNVLGKAGGLQGGRGDVQLPSHVLFSKSSLLTGDVTDDFRTCDNSDVDAQRLSELCAGRSVHTGPVLTIPGTLLQSSSLLQYYKTIWGCVGVEMEGSYFVRQVKESMNLGLISTKTRMRFAYYTSDLPLPSSGGTEADAAKLSTPMKPTEGVPVLYGITRAFLELILFPRRKSSTENININEV